MKRYVYVRGEKELHVAWSGDTCKGVLHLENKELKIDNTKLEGEFSLQVGDTMYRIEAIEAGLYRVNGRLVNAKVLSELMHRFSGFGAGGIEDAGKTLNAPMPGRVVKLLVKIGDEVVNGQGLIIVEAMKMENELKAKKAGVVSEIFVAENDSVEKGALLISF
jgi:biotin carboxyl carrier protein